jgi:UvrB/uvrC motif
VERPKDGFLPWGNIEMKPDKHLDGLLRDWAFDPQNLSVRLVKGDDGRDVIQMRVDLGILQLETKGRPDGSRPNGADTFLESMLEKEQEKAEFVMDDSECFEADREFVQFYHRRIAWLRLQHYHRAVADADHTLALMDICRDHSPDEDWTMSHEQYRPFVLFHRSQAAALAALEESGPEQAVAEINEGLEVMREVFIEHEADDQFEEDEMVVRLVQLRESLREEYAVGRTLQERLAEAVATEQYELAARLRDELARRQEN